jgi:hypothetical protein
MFTFTKISRFRGFVNYFFNRIAVFLHLERPQDGGRAAVLGSAPPAVHAFSSAKDRSFSPILTAQSGNNSAFQPAD